MEVKAREIAILKSFCIYPLLTRQQVTRLHYSVKSDGYVNDVLTAMVSRGLLARPERPHVNDPYFYMLGKKGVRLLREMGIDISFHPSEHTYPSRITMEHTMMVTDTMIAISGISQVSEKYLIFDMLHDVTLKRQKAESVRADIITHLGTNDAHAVLFWEIDRATEAQVKIRQKIRAILNYMKYEYQNPYGTPNITWLFLTTRNQWRFNNFLHWIEAELDELYQKNSKDMFRVAIMPEELTAQHLFFHPIWRIPFEGGWFSLF